MKTPEDCAAERLAARAEKYVAETSRLRELIEPPTYLAARRQIAGQTTEPEEQP